MGLYKLDRVYPVLARLTTKPRWTLRDTASFDCMHYHGDAAIRNAAEQLGLRQGQKVLDIGSGFGVTGRYFQAHYGASTTGIELQTDIHLIAEAINRKTEMPLDVYSVNGNVLDLEVRDLGGAASFDHVVSFLTILHIPQRQRVFALAAEAIKPGGKLYIEDYYAPSGLLDPDAQAKLESWVSCPYLPDRELYITHLVDAGFGKIVWEDMSPAWSEFVHERSTNYKAHGSTDSTLESFYEIVDELFVSGKIKGARITAEKI